MHKLTIITPTFPPEINGVTISLQHLIPALAELSVDVRVFSPDYTPIRHKFTSLSPGEMANYCKIISYPSFGFGGYPFARKPRPYSLRVMPRSPDERILVLEPDRLQYGNLLTPVCNPKSAVAFFRQDYLEAARLYFNRLKFFLARPLLQNFIARVYNKYARVLVLSNYAQENLKRVGVSTTIDKVIQGIDHKTFYVRNPIKAISPLRLVYIGRFALEKNVKLLAKTFIPGSFSPRSIHLDCFGEGPMLEQLKASVDPALVTFHGFVSQEILSNYFADSHFVLSPSPVETFGNTVLEAMASGLPVIGVEAGANCEHIHEGKTGYLVNNDGESLTKLLYQLSKNPPDFSRMSTACTSYAARYNWKYAAENLLECLFDKV